MATESELSRLGEEVRAFAGDRDWGQFHSPRNLVLALVGEVGELASELQWVPENQVDEHLSMPEGRGRFEDEMADVLIYMLRLADVTGVDLAAAVRRKLAKNADRYPVDLSRGTSLKYDQLPEHGASEAGESPEWPTS